MPYMDISIFVLFERNNNGAVMVNMLAWSAVYHGFKPWSGETKDYKMGICCFSAKEKDQRLVDSESE